MKSRPGESRDGHRTAQQRLQFAGTLPQWVDGKLVRNPTSPPFCKTATPSGNTNEMELVRLEKRRVQSRPQKVSAIQLLMQSAWGRRGVLPDAQRRATTSAVMIR